MDGNMEPYQAATRTRDYDQEPRVESPSTSSRGSSPAGSQRAIELTGLRDHRADLSPQSLAAGTDRGGIENKTPCHSEGGGWAFVDDTWLLEGLAMAFSVASFLAIIIILSVYDQKPSPNLSHGLTLNTIVSLLATASRSSLLFAVTAAVGQLKWIWFERRERPVSDMQSFDDATRGPMGSFILLLQHRGLSLASLGAIVTVFAVALDPFVQQILSYPVRQTPSNTDQATMPQARTFAQNTNYTAFTEYFNAGLWTTNFAIDPTCPSGNCTWSEFQSLGFAWTYNATDSKAQDYNCYISTGHGENGSLVIDYHDSYRGAFIPTGILWALNSIGKTNESFLGVDNAVAAFAHAELESEANTNITNLVRGLRIRNAQECILSICLKTYNVSVNSGTPQVNVTSVDYGQRLSHNLTNNAEPWYNDVDCWRPTNQSGPFKWTELATGNWVDTDQFAFCLRTSEEADAVQVGFNSLTIVLSDPPFLGYSTVDYTVNAKSVWTADEDTNENSAKYSESFDRVIDLGLGAVLSDVAAALTKYAVVTSNATVTGTTMIPQTFVVVSWQWLTFPAVLLVGGLVFWIATVAVNRRHRLGLWKSSILPMLYHGAEKEDSGLTSTGAGYTTVSQMSQSARTTHVKLDGLKENRLVLGRNE